MTINELTNDDKIFIRTIFAEMRKSLSAFFETRNFVLSNPQIFTFVTYMPAAMAIASDGVIDNKEIAALEQICKLIDVKTYVSLDLIEIMSVAQEPDNCITNEEFNLRVGSEILYVTRNMPSYINDLKNAVKAMLTFDMNPKKEGSLTQSFNALMDSVVANNISKNKEIETEKISQIKIELGMAI